MKIGQKGGFDLALLQKSPVNSSEPWVLSQVSNVQQPFLRIFLKQPLEKILQFRGPVFVEVRFTKLDLFEEFTSIFGVERRKSVDKFID